MAFLDWSTTAGSNTTIGGIGIQGSNAVQNFDNAFREMMAQLRSGVDGKVVVLTKSAGYTAVAADNNAVIRFTAGATLSLTAAATLGTGWHVHVVADGGAVVIDPNGSETVNGATTITIPDGYSALVFCNGGAFFANKEYATIPAAITSSLGSVALGQCYLRLNGSDLQLIRSNGKLLTINGANYEIPSSGVSLAPTSLSSATVYHIYAYMSGGTMTLEASTTARETSTTTGMQVKTGDPTRTFVGWARTNGSTQWVDNSISAHVISWFNPRKKALLSVQTANNAFTSTSMAKISTVYDLFFLIHPDYAPELRFNGSAFASVSGIRVSVACAVDSTVYEGCLIQPADTGGLSVSSTAVAPSLSEATAYTASVYGAVSSGTGTLQYFSTAPGFRCSLSVTVWG